MSNLEMMQAIADLVEDACNSDCNMFGYSKEKIEKIKECILSHTHRGSVPSERATLEAECIASADAMSHVFQVPSLLHLAYASKGMGIDEGQQWVFNKI